MDELDRILSHKPRYKVGSWALDSRLTSLNTHTGTRNLCTLALGKMCQPDIKQVAQGY